jgi:UDP-N-acetyl-D-mannosaminuronic acid dehydrogenase
MKKKISIIGGCGHVGLPLGIVFAEHDYPTYLYDINPDQVERVNRGEMPHLEEEGPERLRTVLAEKSLLASTDPAPIADSEAIVLSIGTPLDKYLNPDLDLVLSTLDNLLPYLHKDQTLILRSTFYPGTSQILYDHLASKGCNMSVAFCPERIIQGKALTEIKKLPQIISSFDEKGLRVSEGLFREITGIPTITLKPIEAELAKLFCNTWRYINFAISNQLYQICSSAGAEFQRIHEAVTRDYPRMKDFPGAGFTAGPCLFKDTMQLAAFSQNTFFLGHSAMLINEGMPSFVVDLLKQHLGNSLRGRRVAILGMTFKGDNDDVRDSLSFKLKKILEVQGADVVVHDPFLNAEAYPNLKFIELEEAAAADAVLIGAPHTVYKTFGFPEEALIIDIWGITNHTRQGRDPSHGE